MKGMHLLYQLQDVSDDVYIGVALAKPQNWSTQLALTLIPIFQKPPFFLCVHT
jgi:hypothetical protein